MKLFVVALYLSAAAAVYAIDDAHLKGLENLQRVHAAAQLLDFHHGMGTTPELVEPFLDPWGTPYRIDPASRLVAGAGADRTFDESEWSVESQFDGIAGDVVHREGRLVRSNRNWLWRQLGAEGRAHPALAALRNAELLFMIGSNPHMRDIDAVSVTSMKIEALGTPCQLFLRGDGADTSSVAEYLARSSGVKRPLHDAWGTPLRIEAEGGRCRIISAGADRQFDPMSWTRPAGDSAADDIVFDTNQFVRRPDRIALIMAQPLVFQPIPQPPDPVPPGRDDAAWPRVGNGVKAPVAKTRIEPGYPEDYRKAQVQGIVILECEVANDGTVGNVRVLKSLAPDLDMSAADAVRGWTFEPATRDGQPVNALFAITINFKLG